MNHTAKEKKTYIAPSVEMICIRLEEGIAKSSSTLHTGGASATDTPLVEDWKEESSIHDLNF